MLCEILLFCGVALSVIEIEMAFWRERVSGADSYSPLVSLHSRKEFLGLGLG